MFRDRQDRRAVRFVISGALATALVTGCAGSSHLARAGAHAEQSGSKATAKLDRAIAQAEGTVALYPSDAAARAVLGNAYLEAGRFESAATTFQDAVALGDSSPGTALRLALAQIGSGRGQEAAVILDQHRNDLPASDLGLALALAGETGRGVEILADALRGGENTPKLRQNLAYAYALDGRWAEARLMAAQDVPADQLDERITGWAMTGKPEDYNKRVAGLLRAPVRSDEGQPVELALAGGPAAPPPPAFAMPAPSGELPPVEASAAPTAGPRPSVAEAVPAPVVPPRFAEAFAETSRPVVQVPPAPTYTAPVAAKPARRQVAEAKPLRRGSHNVQLGSFSSPEHARRAIAIFRSRHHELKGFELAITPAVVRGRNFWRVSATGFSLASAVGICSAVKTRGGGCIAYSTNHPLPGAVPGGGSSGPALARR